MSRQYFYNKAEKILDLNNENTKFQIEQIKNTSLNSIDYEIKNLINNLKNNKIKNTTNSNLITIGFDINGHAIAASNQIISKIYDKIFQQINVKKINFQQKIFKTNLSNGAHLMIKLKPISVVNSQFGYIMHILIINDFELEILKSSIFCITISLLILIIIFALTNYFMKQTVYPIKKITQFTKKIINNQKNENFNYKFKNSELKNLYRTIKLLEKKLEFSEYAQNDFISSISHELRTPLTAIQGWTETVINAKNDVKISQKGLQIISNEVKRLSKMVEDLLDFSKIRNGHLTLFKEKMDPFAELQEAISIYQNLALKQQKKLIYKDQAQIPIIFGDKNRIKQVFINIIDNAIKYSKKGGIITIQTSTSNKTAKVIVQDTGKGILKQHLNQITEKFFQTNSKNPGSGIGLAIVKEIVQNHDGKLNFKSSPNKGTTVTISFPLINT